MALSRPHCALDTHNAASFWNKALLDNSARPFGALVYAGPDGAHLTDAQVDRLKAELEENFSGADNAGRPLLLEGGLDWKALSLSPKDMDFSESKTNAAREIALAFGAPPLLLGLPGDNTFANYSEANRGRTRPAKRIFDDNPWTFERRARGGQPRFQRDLMTDILNAILERGDLAHLALFLWACVATTQAHVAMREVSEATRRLDAFVRELARFNRRCGSDP